MPMPKPKKWTADDFEIRTSTIEGAGQGLFAKQRIQEEDTIGYYTGEVITEKAFHDPDRPFSAYVLWVSRQHIIIGEGPLSNYTRYINHSDEPNCGGEWADDPKDEVSIAIRDIEEGEEITDDYSVFQDMSCEWLASLFAAHTPERAAFEDNFVAKKPKGYITPVESD